MRGRKSGRGRLLSVVTVTLVLLGVCTLAGTALARDSHPGALADPRGLAQLLWRSTFRLGGLPLRVVAGEAGGEARRVNISIHVDDEDYGFDYEDSTGEGVRVTGSQNDRVAIGSDILVREDEVVGGDVVSLMGSIEVRGVVEGDVVAVGGSVRVRKGAIVDGDCVAMGGTLEVEEGAVVSGEAVGLGGGVDVRRGGKVGGVNQVVVGIPIVSPVFRSLRAIFSSFSLPIVFFVVTGLLGWLAVAIAARRMDTAVAATHERAGLSLAAGFGLGIGYGALLLPLTAVVSVILAVTIVGIPLIVPLILIVLVAPVLGYGVSATAVGRFARRGKGSLAADFWIGHVLISIVLLLVSLLGLLSWTVPGSRFLSRSLFFLVSGFATWYGWGAFVLAAPSTSPGQSAVGQEPALAAPGTDEDAEGSLTEEEAPEATEDSSDQ